MFDSVNVDFGTRILAEEDFVVDLDLHGNYLTIFIKFSFPHPNDPTFLRLFFGGVRDNNTPFGLFFFLNSLDDDAVLKRPDLHAFLLSQNRLYATDLLTTSCQKSSTGQKNTVYV